MSENAKHLPDFANSFMRAMQIELLDQLASRRTFDLCDDCEEDCCTGEEEDENDPTVKRLLLVDPLKYDIAEKPEYTLEKLEEESRELTERQASIEKTIKSWMEESAKTKDRLSSIKSEMEKITVSKDKKSKC